ncbi:hypothetical protein ACFWUQ_19410 [Streptomyces sp. NPDC058662]|uniref:hypothetical protein n=1 Tax=Streptomyces sp. NPDC058662 TaxID=3346583 RepID=UPI0036625F81
MSGRRRARLLRTARTALTRALTAACVVLLCVFGAGPAAATVAEARPAAAAPAEPTEGQPEPAADPEVRAALRAAARGVPGLRRTRYSVFHVKHAPRAARGPVWGPAEPALSLRAVRSVVLRC